MSIVNVDLVTDSYRDSWGSLILRTFEVQSELNENRELFFLENLIPPGLESDQALRFAVFEEQARLIREKIENYIPPMES